MLLYCPSECAEREESSTYRAEALRTLRNSIIWHVRKAHGLSGINHGGLRREGPQPCRVYTVAGASRAAPGTAAGGWTELRIASELLAIYQSSLSIGICRSIRRRSIRRRV